MRKASFFLASLLTITVMTATAPQAEAAFEPPQPVVSEAAYMVNLDTDVVIYEKNPDQRRVPASLTKMMTAILVLENVPDIENTIYDAPSQVFDEFYGKNVSTADFRPYEEATVQDYLYGLLLNSACEAASVLAYHVGGGSIPNFVQMMNDKAKELGAVNTRFGNAHGLENPDQYSTARDMAIIARYAIENFPAFNKIVETSEYTIGPSNKHTESRKLFNTNMLLRKTDVNYPYALGIKTGTLDEAGYCLASYAKKDGYSYLLVTLGAPIYDEAGQRLPLKDRGCYTDAINLYNWAFSTFEITTVISPDEDIMEFGVELGDGKDYVMLRPDTEYSTLLPKNLDSTAIQRIKPDKLTITAPVKKGEVLGELELRLANETLTKVKLLAAEDVALSKTLYYLKIGKEFLSSGWFKLGLGLLAVLIVFFVYLRITSKRRKRQKARPRLMPKNRKYQ